MGGDRHLLRPFSLSSSFLLEALPTCVIVWPPSACLLQSADFCSSPHPPSPSLSLAASLRIPTDWLPSSSPRPPTPPGLQAKSSSFRNWPTRIKFITTAAPESVLGNLQLHSLSCKDHFSQRWRRVFFFLVSLMELPVCILFDCCHEVC